MAQDEEKYQAKMQFFMNASHELKTPLTLILLAAERLSGKDSPAKECKTILTNTKKMLALITELVDIRKADLGIGSLNLKRLNMSQMVARLSTKSARGRKTNGLPPVTPPKLKTSCWMPTKTK